MQTEVLIVGAGPSGLALALWLAKLGVRVRIVDRSSVSGHASRAFALQARTLEHYDRIGVAADAVARGRAISVMNVHLGRDKPQRIDFGDFGQGLSPFPFVLVLLQDDHEKLLIDHLATVGVHVERDLELVELEPVEAGVRARLKGGHGADVTIEAAYVCGCDGAGSTVRELSGIGFPGGSSEEDVYVTDVEATGAMADGELHYVMTGDNLCSVFPLRGAERVRLIGLVPAAVRACVMRVGYDDVADEILRDTGLMVSMVSSFATYRIHQRIASQWRKGRVFLLGDASHVHSPAGGQGLNAGIGDAVNLAWKLAAVLRGRAGETLLDSYQDERVRAARQIAATTDAGFALQAERGPVMSLARLALTRLAPGLARMRPLRRRVFRILSQLAIGYRGARSVGGRAGWVGGGDRLPWVRLGEGGDNFDALECGGWQAHVYGEAGEILLAACEDWGLPLRAFAWTPEMGRAGLARNALYLVRPDGYVACASIRQDPAVIERWRAPFAINFDRRA